MSEVESPLDILLTRFSLLPSSLEKPCDNNKLFLALMLKITRFDDAAPFFGFMPPDIEAIQCDFKSEKSRRLHMLWQWKRKNGRDATYLALVKVFLDMGDKHLAEFVVETLIRNMEAYKISEDLPVDSSQTSPDPLNEQLKPVHHEFIVSERYHPEFERKRSELVLLFDKITEILKEKNISLEKLKFFLSLYEELRNDVTPAKSLEEVIIVVRDFTSLINTNYLEAISKKFELLNAIDLIKNYNDSINEFCKSIPTTHAYGQEFMQHTSESLHKSKVEFVLEWDYDDKKLSDVQSLLRIAFHDKAKHVMVRKVKRGNSVILICYAPPHHHEELKRLVKDNEVELTNEKVLSVTIGGDVILKRKPDDKAKGGVRSSKISKAIAQPPPEPVTCGYDYNIFISTPPDSLKCPVCLLILRKPHQLTCCGVLICQVCIKRGIDANQQTCPCCRKNFTTILDKRTQSNDLYDLQVRCENHDCVWKGKLGELHRHLSNKCQYVIEKCRYGCGKYYHRYSLQFHEEEECPNRSLQAKIDNKPTNVSEKYKSEVESPQVVMDTQENIEFHEMEKKRLPVAKERGWFGIAASAIVLLLAMLIAFSFIIKWYWIYSDGMQVIGQTHFAVTGGNNKYILDWVQFQLHIEIPKGSLPAGSTTELHVKAIIGGDFILPPDCYLVSGIYQIISFEQLKKNITLHLPHAAIIKSEEEASYFRFYTADCSSGPPYEFKEMEGGYFRPHSNSATIGVNHFGCFATGKIKHPMQRYLSQVLYKPVSNSAVVWNVVFAITKDDPTFVKHVQQHFHDYHVDEDFLLQLQENATYLELTAESYSISYWNVYEVGSSQIERTVIESYDPKNSSYIPHCTYEFIWLSDLSPRTVNLKYNLVGAYSEFGDNEFSVLLPPEAIEYENKETHNVIQSTIDNKTGDGMQVVDEKSFTVTGDNSAFTLDWIKFGLRIEIPKGSLLAGSTTELHVKAIIGGDFILPPDCYLVSGIYQISSSEQFKKNFTLHLPHAAIIKSEEEASYFRFYTADCSSGPPYEFKEMEGGYFRPHSNSATIDVHHFSCYTIGAITIRPDQQYISHLFYKSISDSINKWKMIFTITKDEKSFVEHVSQKYHDCPLHDDFTVQLQENATYLKIIPKSYSISSWDVYKGVSSQIERTVIESYDPKNNSYIPHYTYECIWQSDSSPSTVNLEFMLVGADSDNNFDFSVLLPLEDIETDNVMKFIMDGGLISSDENLLVHLDVITHVQSFCVHLKITLEDCDEIDEENHENLENQKIAILRKWNQIKEQRTWKEFILPFALLRNCAKAKELAIEYSVYFEHDLKDDKKVLKRCKYINNHG